MTVITVTNSADQGSGSLRQAIYDAQLNTPDNASVFLELKESDRWLFYIRIGLTIPKELDVRECSIG